MERQLTEKLLSLYRDLDCERDRLRHFMPTVLNGKKYCAATTPHNYIFTKRRNNNWYCSSIETGIRPNGNRN